MKDDAVVVKHGLMVVACVVEAGLQLRAEPHLAAHAERTANQPMPVLRSAGLDRHEVLHLGDAVRRQEAGDQHVRIREVELLRRTVLDDRRDAVVAAALTVEDRAEHARRVEARAAVPVDPSVRADERDAVQIADDAVLGDRQVIRQRRGRRGRDHDLRARHGFRVGARRFAAACAPPAGAS